METDQAWPGFLVKSGGLQLPSGEELENEKRDTVESMVEAMKNDGDAVFCSMSRPTMACILEPSDAAGVKDCIAVSGSDGSLCMKMVFSGRTNEPRGLYLPQLKAPVRRP